MNKFVIGSRPIAGALLYLLVTVLHSQPKVYIAQYTNTPIKIDGRMDESAWNTAGFTTDFIDIQGDDHPMPTKTTNVKMLWDDDFLYIAGLIHESDIQGSLTKKNSVIYKSDNNFEVFIDPDGNGCNYYELELNALNTIWELSLPIPYRNSGHPIDPDNIAGLKSATSLFGTINNGDDRDSAWSIEIAIPLEQFKKFDTPSTPPSCMDHWRINFSRVEWPFIWTGGEYKKKDTDKESNWTWSSQGQINMHAPEKWGYLYFQKEDCEININHRSEYRYRDKLMVVHEQIEKSKSETGHYPKKLDGIVDLAKYPSTLKYQLKEVGYKLSVKFKINKDRYRLTVTEDSCIKKTLSN